MQKYLEKDWFISVLISVLFVILLPFFFMKQGLLLIDTGREYYISQQVMQGKVLYKDILNIYGPFAYQLNAVLFSIFGDKLSVPYVMGVINSLVMVLSIFFLSREFLNKQMSALISVLTIFSLVYTPFLYNSNIAYSYGFIYATSSLLLSILFFIKSTKNIKYSYFASFFAGMCLANKYEFILFPILLFFVFAFSKELNIKEKLLNLLALFFLPVTCLAVLFVQGLTFSDLKNAFEIMLTMATSDNMRLFYSNFGNMFLNFSSYISAIINTKFFAVLGFLPIINLILFLAQIKSIKENKTKLLFCIASILASLKFILFMNVEHMGAFYFPLCILTTFVLCEKFNNNQLKYIILLGLISLFITQDFNALNDKTYNLKTSKGSIQLYERDGRIIDFAYSFITQMTRKTDKVLVLPEGAIINYLTNRKSDNQFHNLVPLYYSDTFGEEKVLKHFNDNPVDYYVILPISTSEYGSDVFCSYANNFCNMIKNSSDLIIENNGIQIYKRKNI